VEAKGEFAAVEILERVFDGVMLVNTEGVVTYVNTSFQKMLGRSVGELVGKSAFELPTYQKQGNIEKIEALFGQIIEKGYGEPLDIQGVTKNGSEISLNFTVSVMKDSEGNPKSFLMIVRDITERKRAESERLRLNAELAEKNRELEQIVYVASHDLRSPLVNVQGFSKELRYSLREVASILQGENIPSEMQHKISNILESDIADCLRYVEASVTKMDSLLGGLLRLSRLGRVALKFEQLDMNQLIEEIVQAFEYAVKEAGAELKVSNLPPCVGDHVQINQLFSNLLDNALKYRDPERTAVIEITGQQANDQVVYCVRDNGIGIPEEHYSKIFEIFQRLNPSATTGEGLGLSIVKKILSRHNGSIWVESEPGVGSRFFVSLPSASKH
jgi:PAS domain S-box-containing protein